MAGLESEDRGNHLVGDGSVSLRGTPVDRRETGTWKAAIFIYVLIFADTVSVLGIAANLVIYLRGTLHLTIAEAANITTNFVGFAYLIPIFWGFLADSYVGRFWIIIIGSVLCLAGLVTLALSASLPSLQPPQCTPSTENLVCPKASKYVLSWLYGALLLVAVGSAGLKPCMVSLGQDQFDETDPVEKKKGSSFFRIYFITLNCFTMFCASVLSYLQTNVSFPWGYKTVAAIYFVGISIFYLGTPRYRHMKAGGSTLTRAAQVLTSAAKNMRKTLPQSLYEIPREQAKAEGIHQIAHTNRLRCLDKAAIVTNGEEADRGSNRWKRCTVTQVEELKSILQILPIWFCLILVFTLYAQVVGVGVQQAATLDRRLGSHFIIPAASTAVALQFSAVIFIIIYDKFIVPQLTKLTGHPQGLSPLRRIGFALLLTVVAMLVSAGVEGMRLKKVRESNLISNKDPRAAVDMPVWWLVPQFALLGCVEILLGVAQLQFLYRETPESMRSLAVSLSFMNIAIGYFVSAGLVNTVNKYSEKTGGWLAEEFNTGGLQKYYYLLAAIMSANLLIFVALAHFYAYKPLQPRLDTQTDEEGQP